MRVSVRVHSPGWRRLLELTAGRPAVVLAATAIVTSGCASTGAVPRPFPVPTVAGTADDLPEHPTERDVPAAPAAVVPPPETVLATALDLVGSPYRNGGANPEGFDCSGFTQWVFGRHGILLPRETRDQFSTGIEIDALDVSAGDLVFFSTVAPGASHVGIALDADRFVHAPSSRGVVRIERRSGPYWSRRFVGARRLAAN